MQSGHDLLRVNDIVTEFGHEATGPQVVVKGVSFSVRSGETLGIVGESGSGKTVAMMSVLGLASYFGARVTAGQAWLDGQDLLQLHSRQLRKIRGGRIGVIFQDPMTSLNPVMTIKRQLVEPLREHLGMRDAAATKRAAELLDMVRIADPARCLESYPHELSGGMRQRVMIAMALACRPSLLIADEPTTALDVTIQAQILELIADFSRELKMAVVVISHDFGVVARLADRVAVMYAGSIVEIGGVEQVFKQPQHPYTLLLLRSALRIDEPGHLVQAPSAEPAETLPSVGCPFRPRCDFAIARCAQEAPPLEPTPEPNRSTHFAACWSTGRIGSAEIAASASRLSSVAKEQEADKDILITVRDLHKTFAVKEGVFGRREVGRIHALGGVSFDIRRGETLGVVGESGCGKTTLGRVLLHLQKPTSGTVSFDGTDLASLNATQLRTRRKDMQLIFQDPFSSLDPRMRASAIISEPLRIHGIGDRSAQERVVADLLDRVGLGAPAGHRYPHEFSGGQRQRIGIARALALNPSFIVCDEAVSALDVSIQYQVLSLLAYLAREFGLTYLFISHNLAAVRFISDRILVMYLGKVVESAPSENLFKRPRHPYTQALLAAIPIPDPEVERNRPRVILQGEMASALYPPSGCQFHTRCPFVQDICRIEEPRTEIVEPDHSVSCHFWRSIGAETTVQPENMRGRSS